MAKNSVKRKYYWGSYSKYRKQYDNHCVRQERYLLSLGDIGYKTDKCGIPLKPKQEDEKYILYGKDGNVLYEHFKSKHLKNNSRVMRNDLLFQEDLKLYKKDIEKYLKEKQPCVNMQGILIWYDGELEKLNRKDYARILAKEYNRQRNCAIRGYIAWVQPSEHFLFDFDLEWMLKENASCSYGKNKLYITKWWKGEIRHWTVNDGIWKEG